MECASNEPTDTRHVVGIQISAQLQEHRENVKGPPYHPFLSQPPFQMQLSEVGRHLTSFHFMLFLQT